MSSADSMFDDLAAKLNLASANRSGASTMPFSPSWQHTECRRCSQRDMGASFDGVRLYLACKVCGAPHGWMTPASTQP